jgi:hypothetical protein
MRQCECRLLKLLHQLHLLLFNELSDQDKHLQPFNQQRTRQLLDRFQRLPFYRFLLT